MAGQIGVLRGTLADAVAVDIGAHGKTGVLDLAVMDDPRIVAHHFNELLSQIVAQGVDECAVKVTRRPKAAERVTLEEDLEVEALKVQARHPTTTASSATDYSVGWRVNRWRRACSTIRSAIGSMVRSSTMASPGSVAR